MKRKIFKKVLSTVLMAAMLLTSNGIASANAAEKIYIEGVYTNFQKATMAIGTTRQVNAYVEPSNASVQRLRYESSNISVATVSAQGLITAVAEGTATIVVKALDGSSQQEEIAITVLPDLYLEKANVDKDNEIIVLDGAYGNLVIDSSVGDAAIYLSNVTVRNEMRLDNGTYVLNIYDSKLNKVILDHVESQIQSFSTTNKNAEAEGPQLNILGTTVAADVLANISAKITRGNKASIEGLKVTQDTNGKLLVTLEGYAGDLLVDGSLGDIELSLVNSNVDNLTYAGIEKVGAISIKGAESYIANMQLSGSINVELGVATGVLVVDKDAKAPKLNVNTEVEWIQNFASDTVMNITGKVLELESAGAKAAINIGLGAHVEAATIDGDNSKVDGYGKLDKITIMGNNNRITVVNAEITVGKNATGTYAGADKMESGLKGVVPPMKHEEDPKNKNEEDLTGTVILQNDFEDFQNGLQQIMGAVQMDVVSGGNNSDKALRVSNRTQDWHGASLDLNQYIQRRVTVRVKLDMMSEQAGTLSATMSHKKSGESDARYAQVAAIQNAEANTWYSLEGIFELAYDVTEATLYIHNASSKTANYYLDNVEIIVDSVGPPVPVSGVSLNHNTARTYVNRAVTLQASVLPASAENKALIWYSANPDVAVVTPTVDGKASVKGIAPGTAEIYVVTVEGYYKAFTTVTVLEASEEPPAPSLINVDFESSTPTLGAIGALSSEVITTAQMGAEVAHDGTEDWKANTSNKVLKITHNGGWAPSLKLTVHLDEGTTLAQYDSFSMDIYMPTASDGQGYTWKNYLILLGHNLNAADASSPAKVAEYNTQGNQKKWITLTYNIKDTVKAYAEEATVIDLVLSMPTNTPQPYYIDNIVLTPAAE